jgi:NAD(P)-dependent dehydrogenase (short-subunit alcohol dehydrogenase family)/rhamnose utilization protein RhaD (predicted bifunctional aldolase and dehydrogenase)
VDSDLSDMLKISHAVGAAPRMVQGGGGNTSVKTDGGRLMYVKASGMSLADMCEGRGYRLVDVRRCAAIACDEKLGALEAAAREAEVLHRLVESCVDDLAGRPSVETSLHALLARCVVHTHPSVVNGLLCAVDGRRVLDETFAHLAPPVLYVEFAGAGYTLARRLQAALRAYQGAHGVLPQVIFLENHGLVVTTQDADEALRLTHEVFATVEEAARRAWQRAGPPPFDGLKDPLRQECVEETTAAMRRFYSGLFGGRAVVCFSDEQPVPDFLRLAQAAELCRVGPIMPDQVVYCRERPVWIALGQEAGSVQAIVADALEQVRAGLDTPLCIMVPRLGLFCAAPDLKFLGAVSGTMRAVLESLCVASLFGGARGLDDEALGFLRNWEVERFRRTSASGGRPTDELAGKVALVTGAGSGLGRGISLHLAAKGACLALADINLAAARETAGRMAAEGCAGTGLPIQVDVTDEASVARMVHEVVTQVGGLDILVNCAGVAFPHALLDFPVEDWRKCLEVNLTGYFLVGQAAARRMARQKTGGAIVNVSSKSGLDASRNHSAYNATKAAEIHLARGWALELAEHGIRVNALCPGNVFTESGIWNEDYVRSMAAKRGIKPEEVIPHYVNLTALKQEVTWQDIGEAVAFLVSSRAAKITGQTLVVDAGQVFVR